MKQLPSLFRIVKVDYLASLGVIFPVVLWGLALATRLFDPEAASFFWLIAPIATVAGLLLLLWRVWAINQVFNDGAEVPGVIIGTSFFRGRGRVEYVYTYQSQKYQSGNAIQASPVARSLAPGQAVTLMVDRLNPKRAFARELYF